MKSYIILILLCCSCSGMKDVDKITNLPCNENKEFKERFFKNIKVVDDFMSIGTKTVFVDIDEYQKAVTLERVQEFKSALEFISKYTRVSFESMLNYDGSYPIGVYEKDKAGWLKWYEENKCSNIQFKNP